VGNGMLEVGTPRRPVVRRRRGRRRQWVLSSGQLENARASGKEGEGASATLEPEQRGRGGMHGSATTVARWHRRAAGRRGSRARRLGRGS
jgi:hypothetical protein